MNVKTTVTGGEQYRKAMLLLVKSTRQGAKTEVGRASRGTASLARKEAPKATGLLKAGLSQGQAVTITDNGLTGVVSIPAPSRAFVYGPFVEGLFNGYKLGRRPGRMPPFEPIFNWVRVKRLASKWKMSEKSATFIVRRKIGRKGTPAQPFMKPATDHWIPEFRKNIERVFSQAAQSIGRLRGGK